MNKKEKIVRCCKCGKDIDITNGRPEGVIEDQIALGQSEYTCEGCVNKILPW